MLDSRVKAMIGTVTWDQVVGQFMAKHDPPINQRISSFISRLAFLLHARQMQLQEEPVIAEYASVGVESNRATFLVVIHVQTPRRERKYHTEFSQ